MAPPSATDMPSISDIQAETFSGPLSVNGVSTRRAKAPKMSGGIAAHASSDMFKSSVRDRGRVPADTEGHTEPILEPQQT